MPTPASPEATARKLHEIAEGLATGRTRWVLAVYCIEGGIGQSEGGLLVPGYAEGGVVRALRHGESAEERTRCLREVLQIEEDALRRAGALG